MLEIKNLHVEIDGKVILKGLDLVIPKGEVHAIMGPNGSGKSTLSYVIAGRENYEVTQGEILLDGKNVLDMEVEERAAAGLFLAFQYPLEIAGVPTNTFLKTSVNAIRKLRGDEELKPVDMLRLMKEKAVSVNMDTDMLRRGLNVGFSGGEKKRNEVLQMLMLDPKMCVLDETDSGLDIDALQVVAEGVNSMRGAEKSFLVITHYQRLLDYIVPDKVHVLADGKIQETGDRSLALELEKSGYAKYLAA